jgi:hypothetical protein
MMRQLDTSLQRGSSFRTSLGLAPVVAATALLMSPAVVEAVTGTLNIWQQQ